MAKPRKAKGAGKPQGGARKGGRKGAPKGRAPSLSRKMAKLDKLVETLGREKLKPGPIRVGKTRTLTAGKRGQAAFRNIIHSASQSKALKTFSYAVTIKTAEGVTQRPRRVVPDLRRMRKGRKESHVHFRKRIENKIMRDLQKEIFANVTSSTQRATEKIVTDKRGVKRRLRAYESGKAVTFQVEVFAEV